LQGNCAGLLMFRAAQPIRGDRVHPTRRLLCKK
jgi:hypothetical protein